MAYQSIEIGTAANDGTGDTLRAGGDKVNDNFVEIYTLLGTGTALTSGISATSSVVSLASPTITGVTSFAIYASHPSLTPTASISSAVIFAGVSGSLADSGVVATTLTNTSRQIAVDANTTSGTFILGTQGFLDFRG